MGNNHSAISIMQSIICAICMLFCASFFFLPTNNVEVFNPIAGEEMRGDDVVVSLSYFDLLKNKNLTSEEIEQQVILAQSNKDVGQVGYYLALNEYSNQDNYVLAVSIIVLVGAVCAIVCAVLSLLTPFFYGCNVASIIMVILTFLLSISGLVTNYILNVKIGMHATLHYIPFIVIIVGIIGISSLIMATLARIHHTNRE